MDKTSVRTDILARRRALTRDQLAVAAARLCTHAALAVRATGARRVCCYVPVGTEPGSPALLDALVAAGAEVLLPVLLLDGDLDWSRFVGHGALISAKYGLWESSEPRRGVGAVGGADLVLVPALAVDPAGHRLGRGGGSYDRALDRVRRGVPVVALLHDGEVLDEVPIDLHDRPVTHVITPAGGWRPVG